MKSSWGNLLCEGGPIIRIERRFASLILHLFFRAPKRQKTEVMLEPVRAASYYPGMIKTKDDLFKRLDELNITTTTVAHAAAFTVEDAKIHRGELPGAHAKNLFLKDKKGVLWLVVCLEDRDVDMKDLRRRIGSAHLSFGRADLLMEVLGVEPGSVSPFTLINDPEMRVQVVLDADMMGYDLLNFHPLENTATTQISPDDLKSFIRSCGHQAEIVRL